MIHGYYDLPWGERIMLGADRPREDYQQINGHEWEDDKEPTLNRGQDTHYPRRGIALKLR